MAGERVSTSAHNWTWTCSVHIEAMSSTNLTSASTDAIGGAEAMGGSCPKSLGTRGPKSAEFDRCRPHVAQCRPGSAKLWRILLWPFFCNATWATLQLTQLRSTGEPGATTRNAESPRSYAPLDPELAEFAKTSLPNWRKSSHVSRIRSNIGQVSRNLQNGRFGPEVTELARNYHLDQILSDVQKFSPLGPD